MAVAEPGNFFKQKRSSSEIKAEILPQYVALWVKILVKNKQNQPAKPFFLVDLQAGTGLDLEELPTFPIIILNEIFASTGLDDDLNEAVQTYFYDSSDIVLARLLENIANLPYLQNLANPPEVLQDPEAQVALLEKIAQLPALIALDPFSSAYAGKMLNAASTGSMADFFMVFSYNKMRQAVLATEPKAEILQFFGEEAINKIRKLDQTEKSAKKREQLLLQALDSVMAVKNYFTFKFKVNQPGKDVTSHYIVLATKHKAGYLGIKEILNPYSTIQEDGVPLFTANQKEQPPLLPGFFQFFHEFLLESLVADLAQKKSQFHYRTIAQIIEEHSIGTNYIKQNYFTALTKLSQIGHINLVDANNKKVKSITEETVVFYKLHGHR